MGWEAAADRNQDSHAGVPMNPDPVIDYDVDLALDRAFESWPLLRFTKAWDEGRGCAGVYELRAISRASGEFEEATVAHNELARMTRAQREIVLSRATRIAAEVLSRRLPTRERMIRVQAWRPLGGSLIEGKEIPPVLEPVQFEPVGVTLDILSRAIDAVLSTYGAQPTHLLVGWQTHIELTHYHSWALSKETPEDGSALLFRDVPLRIDPTREQAVIAVPPLEYLLGNPLPKDAVWEPSG